jgi:hypothetical protein
MHLKKDTEKKNRFFAALRMTIHRNARATRRLTCSVLLSVWLLGGAVAASAQPQQQTTPQSTINPQSEKKPAKQTEEEKVLYNREAAPVVPNEIERSKLVMHAPQWSIQLFEFPQDKTIEAYRGKASPNLVAETTLWIARVLLKPYVPQDLPAHLLPLKSYAILYRDWIDHGGSDAFLVRYQLGTNVFQTLETPNYVLIAYKDISRKQAEPLSKHVEYALSVAEQILQKELVATKADAVTLLDMPKDVNITTGYWKPNIALAKMKAEHAESFDEDILSDSVRFCTNGDVVAFEVFKYIWTASVENPFTSRFGIIVDTKADERLFTMLEEHIKSNPSLNTPKKRIEFLDRIKDRLVTRQAEEYLGPLLYDYDGNKITATIPFKNLDAAVSALTDDQKTILVNERMVDEYYIRGLKAFNQKDYAGAIADWCQVLELDPLNVRAAILLQIAMDFREVQMAFAGEAALRKDPSLVSAREALAAHRQHVLKQRLIQKEEELTSQEIAAHQIKAIDYYTEGHFADAIREWDQVLKIDPSNARALLFREMAIGQLKKATKE